MRKHKERVQKKWFKLIAGNLSQGKPISRFHAQRLLECVQLFADKQYHNVFRPWWYEQLDSNPKLDFMTETKRHFAEVEQKLVEMTGIAYEDFNGIAASLKKSTPRKARKRKEKPPAPIRKLRKPEEFKIKLNTGEATVIGERVFSIRGYDFFIYLHEGPHWNLWIVSDTGTGIRVSAHERYKKAVSEARMLIEKHFDSYVQAIKKYKGEA